MPKGYTTTLTNKEFETRLKSCCRACSHPRYRDLIWCREHALEVVAYKRKELSWEEFVHHYGVDPRSGINVCRAAPGDDVKRGSPTEYHSA